jgi:putative membrane protein
METTARHTPTPSPFALLIVRWVALAAAFAFTAWVLNGVDITGGFWAYVWVALIFGIVNAIIGTILRILTLPFNLITLGLISLLITAVLLSITDALTDHLTIDDFFWTTIWAAIILAIASVVDELVLQLIFWREPVVAAKPRSELEGPADREDADVDVRRELGGGLLELRHRSPQEVPRRLARGHGVVGAPVDRHGDARPDERECLGGSPRIEVAGSEGRPPAPDGDERDVGVGRDLGQSREEVGVAEEIDLLCSADDVAEGLGLLAEQPPGVVLGVDGLNAYGAHFDLIAGTELANLRRKPAVQKRAGAPRDDDPLRAAQAAQRREVEVVVVDVRDEDCVEVLEASPVERLRAPQHDDSLPQERIGHEPDAVQLEENGRVPDPPEAVAH